MSFIVLASSVEQGQHSLTIGDEQIGMDNLQAQVNGSAQAVEGGGQVTSPVASAGLPQVRPGQLALGAGGVQRMRGGLQLGESAARFTLVEKDNPTMEGQQPAQIARALGDGQGGRLVQQRVRLVPRPIDAIQVGQRAQDVHLENEIP